MALSFSDIKQIILNRAKRLEVCDAYQKVLLAEDMQALIIAGINLVTWAYHNGVIDDALAGVFPEETLNQNGIYTTGSFTLTNPTEEDYIPRPAQFIALEGQGNALELFILKTAEVTLNITDNNACNVTVMGSGGLNLNLSGNAHCKLNVYDGSATIVTITDNAVLCLLVTDNAAADITATGDAVTHATTNAESVMVYAGSGTSYGLFKAFNRSEITITSLSGTASVDTRRLNNSIINEPVMP